MGGPGAKGACAVKLKPRCRSCGRSLGNPLTHRCVTRTDSRQRKAAAVKPKPKPATPGNAHEYTACEDENCPRFACKVYKEGVMDGYAVGFPAGFAQGHALGYERGYREGYRRGYEEGNAAGYKAGFDAGLASCPGPHGG